MRGANLDSVRSTRPTRFELVRRQVPLSIYLSFKSQLFLPGLVLLYSTVEQLASFEGTSFKEWCEEYLQPPLWLGCSSEDLCTARCQLLHRPNCESCSAEPAQGKIVYYCWTPTARRQPPSSDNRPSRAIQIDPFRLLLAFDAGLTRYAASLGSSKRIEREHGDSDAELDALSEAPDPRLLHISALWPELTADQQRAIYASTKVIARDRLGFFFSEEEACLSIAM